MSWRLRVVHSTGFAYHSPVTSSYNEARLTPRSDARQNVIVNRVETVPATRSYRYTDYWGTAVTAFDLHAPHNELEVSGLSVVETEAGQRPDEEDQVSWDDVNSDHVIDRYDEMLSYTPYVARNRSLLSTAKKVTKGLTPEEAVEAVIEAMRGDKQKLAEESADLLYHLMVLWADAGVKPETVYGILADREGISGIAEKKSRKQGSGGK